MFKNILQIQSNNIINVNKFVNVDNFFNEYLNKTFPPNQILTNLFKRSIKTHNKNWVKANVNINTLYSSRYTPQAAGTEVAPTEGYFVASNSSLVTYTPSSIEMFSPGEGDEAYDAIIFSFCGAGGAGLSQNVADSNIGYAALAGGGSGAYYQFTLKYNFTDTDTNISYTMYSFEMTPGTSNNSGSQLNVKYKSDSGDFNLQFIAGNGGDGGPMTSEGAYPPEYFSNGGSGGNLHSQRSLDIDTSLFIHYPIELIGVAANYINSGDYLSSLNASTIAISQQPGYFDSTGYEFTVSGYGISEFDDDFTYGSPATATGLTLSSETTPGLVSSSLTTSSNYGSGGNANIYGDSSPGQPGCMEFIYGYFENS
jgi:hypothetical protein